MLRKIKKFFLFPAESDTFVLITHLLSNQSINSKRKLVSLINLSIQNLFTFYFHTKNQLLGELGLNGRRTKRFYMHTLPSCPCQYWSLRNGQAMSLRGLSVKGSPGSGVILSETQAAITSQTQVQSLDVSPLVSIIISPKLYHFQSSSIIFEECLSFALLHTFITMFLNQNLNVV